MAWWITIFLTLICRGGAALGGIVLSLVIARVAGAEGLGRFAVFLSLLGVLAILARRGQDSLLIRAAAWSRARATAGATMGIAVALLRLGLLRSLALSLVLGLSGAALLASGWLGSPFPNSVALMPVVLLLLVGLALVAGYSKGVSRPWLAPLFEIGGISLVAALLLGLLAIGTTGLEAGAVMGAFVGALAILALAAFAMILRDMPQPRRLPPLSREARVELRRGQLEFTLIALAGFLTRAGSFLLAAPFLSEAELGLLRGAERLALLVSFPVLAINPIIAPRIVRLTRGKDGAGLRRMMSRAILTSGGLGAPLLLGLLLWPGLALSLMGLEFIQADVYLRIMAITQFAVAGLAPMHMLLNMSGHERRSMWINVFVLVFSVLAIPTLCHYFGPVGFVAAYAVGIILRSLMFFLYGKSILQAS